jgi:hypothetical protein
MKRELSPDTFFVKFVLSGILILISILVCLLFVWMPVSGQGFHPSMVFFLCLWMCIVGSWCYFVMIPLKKLSIDAYAGRLYISNYFKEISVPLSEIEDAEETGEFRGLHCITLYLRTPTEFGRKIKFLPYAEMRWWWNWKEHSLVGELKRMARAQDVGVDDSRGAG